MIKDALEFTFARADDLAAAKEKARSLPTRIDWMCTPTKQAYVFQGQLEYAEKEPELRYHEVDSIASLCEAGGAWSTGAVVWVDREKIVLILEDDGDRRNNVTLPLFTDPVFKTVESLGCSNSPISQADLIRLLRREFRSATGAEKMLNAVRKIKFSENRSGHSNLTHGNESLGQQIEAECSGATDIPEDLLVECTVFASPGERGRTVCIPLDLEVMVREQKFLLRPLPGEVDRAFHVALYDIADRIKEGLPGATVLFGRP